MFSVITKYHKGRHSLFLYNSEIFYAFTQDILRSQDDLWVPNKISTVLEKAEIEKMLNTHTPIEFYSDAYVADFKGLTTGRCMLESIELPKNDQDSYKFFALNDVVTGARMCLNKAAVMLINDISSIYLEKVAVHDYFISLLVATFGRVIPIEEPLIYYRQHGNNLIGAGEKKASKFSVSNWRAVLRRLRLFINDGNRVFHLVNEFGKNYLTEKKMFERTLFFSNFVDLNLNNSLLKRKMIVKQLAPWLGIKDPVCKIKLEI